MDSLTRQQLKQLAEMREDPCVSIFMPAHRSGKENEQDRIRLKNLIRQAEDRLVQRGLRTPAARAVAEPAENLLADVTFWQRGTPQCSRF